MAAMSNEAMYRQNWSRFVDRAIVQRATPGGYDSKQGNSATQKIELRDLMWLEELLSKLEIVDDSGARTSRDQQRKEGRRGREEFWGANDGCDSEDCRKGVAEGVELNEMDRKPLAELTRSSRVINSASTARRHPSFLSARQSPSARPVLAVIRVGSSRMASGADTIGVGEPSMGAQSPMCGLENLEYSKPPGVAELDVVVADTKVERGKGHRFGTAKGDDTHGSRVNLEKPRTTEVTEHVNFSSTGRAIVPGARPSRFAAGEDQAGANSGVPYNPDWDETRIIETNDNADDVHMTGTAEELLGVEQLVNGQFDPSTADECDISDEGGMLGVTVLDCSSHSLRDSRLDGSVMRVTADRDSAIMNSTSSPCPSLRGPSLEAAIFMSEAPESVQDAGQAHTSRGSPVVPATIVHSPTAKEGIIVNLHEVASSFETAASSDACSPHSPLSHLVLDDSPNRASKEDALVVANPRQSPRVRPGREVVSSGQVDTEVGDLHEGDPDETYLSENCVDYPEISRLGSTARKSSRNGGVDGSRQEPVFTPNNRRLTDNREAGEYNRRSDAELFIYAVPSSLGASEKRKETFASQLSPGIAGAFGLGADDAPSPVAHTSDPHFVGDTDFEDHTAWASPTSEGPGICSSPAKSEASTMSLILTPGRLGSESDAVDKSTRKNVGEPKHTPTAPGLLLQQSSPPTSTGHDAEAEEGMRAVPLPESLSLSPQKQRQRRGYASPRPPRESARRDSRTQNTWARTQQSKKCNSGSSDSVEKPALNDRSPVQAMIYPEARHQHRRTPQTQARRPRQEAPKLESPSSASDGCREDSSAASPRRIDEHLSISSISASEVVDHISISHRECAEGELKMGSSEGKRQISAGDISLVEGTPRGRERGKRSESDLLGFYAPLSVTHPMKVHTEDPILSAVQRSTLEWMLWRETGSSGGGRIEASAGLSRTSESSTVTEHGLQSGALGDVVVTGGMLGHLPCEEANECLMALIQGETVGTPSERLGRPGVEHSSRGLPQGATLVIAPSKEAAAKWSDRLTVSRCGLSVLNYVMSLRERRRLTARQVASFDAVVTTYDILKAKEVAPVIQATASKKSPHSCRRPAVEWRSRSVAAQGREKGVSTSKNMVSLLHGVWWHRVIADRAENFVNQRNARAEAVFRLVGRARWCVVDREDMHFIENASDRMRSLARFLGVSAETALVEAASCLFYNNRASHIAPISPRGSSPYRNCASTSSEDHRQRQEENGTLFSPSVRSPARKLPSAAGRRGRRKSSRLESGASEVFQACRADGCRNVADVIDRGGAAEKLKGNERGGGSTISKSTFAGVTGQIKITRSSTPTRGDQTGVGGQSEDGRGRTGAGLKSGLTREDVTYAATALRLHSVQNGP